MEKLTHKIAALPPDSCYFSLEFFPPKTQAGSSNLQARLARMAQALRPLFVTVTWGAGGSTATKSLELAEICQRQLGLTTCLHLTCTNMNRAIVDEALQEAKALGIRNILALRGDPPRSEEYHQEDQEDSNKDFTWAIDLVRYIRKVHGDYFCIGVAGYPEGHSDESCPEYQTIEHDLPFLVHKVEAGADFIMTQLTYDLDAYSRYEKTLRSHPSGTFKNIPIIPGLMPVQSYQILKRVTKLSHAKIPAPILSRIEAVKSDDEAVKRAGVEILSEIVESMKTLPQPQYLPRGFHFYTLNLEKSVALILERCRLIPMSKEHSPSDSDPDSEFESAIAASHDTIRSLPLANGQPDMHFDLDNPRRFSRRRASSNNFQPHNRLIIDRPSQPHTNGAAITSRSNSRTSSQTLTHETGSQTAGVPASNPTRATNLQISEGHGSLGREATWDDFPNGRWGPSHSPAYGEVDGYGPSLKVGPVTARKLWSHPKNRDDVTEIFRRHVLGEVSAVPWSDETDVSGGALREETLTIRTELLRLIEGKKYWTLASQPAVNGVRSDDAVFGWGPPGEGFVFQKAFVEFFCSKQDWEGDLKPKLARLPEEEVSWLKTDKGGDFESSTLLKQQQLSKMNGHTNGVSLTSKRTPGASGVNAVTWGVFRGKEIVTPTIIEEQSFRAWGEEAFGIWEEWRRVFPRGSAEEKALQKMMNESVLVNVVGQQFHGGKGGRLWEILGS